MRRKDQGGGRSVEEEGVRCKERGARRRENSPIPIRGLFYPAVDEKRKNFEKRKKPQSCSLSVSISHYYISKNATFLLLSTSLPYISKNATFLLLSS